MIVVLLEFKGFFNCLFVVWFECWVLTGIARSLDWQGWTEGLRVYLVHVVGNLVEDKRKTLFSGMISEASNWYFSCRHGFQSSSCSDSKGSSLCSQFLVKEEILCVCAPGAGEYFFFFRGFFAALLKLLLFWSYNFSREG